MMQQKVRLRQKHKSPIGPQQHRSAALFRFQPDFFDRFRVWFETAAAGRHVYTSA